MKLSGRSVADFLQRPDQGYIGALIYGADSGAVREHFLLLKQKLLSGAGDAFGYSELTEEEVKSDPARLADECGALSLLGGRRLVVLRGAGDRHSKAVEAALPLLGRDCYLLALADELAAKSSLRLLFEQHKQLAALPCYKEEGADLAASLRKLLESHQLRPEAGVVEYLAAHLGNDRAVTRSEVQKLALYKGGQGSVTLEDVEALIHENKDTKLDDITHALADQNASALLLALERTFREGVQPIAVLRACQRYFQRLYSIRVAMEAGKSVDQAVAELRPPVFFRQQPGMKRHAQAWNPRAVGLALQRLEQAELACKSTGADAVLLTTEALTKFVLKAAA